MEKLYTLVVETIDTDVAELMSRKVMAISSSVDKLKEHFAQVNVNNNIDYEYHKWSEHNNVHSLFLPGNGVCTTIIIEEVTFIQ